VPANSAKISVTFILGSKINATPEKKQKGRKDFFRRPRAAPAAAPHPRRAIIERPPDENSQEKTKIRHLEQSRKPIFVFLQVLDFQYPFRAKNSKGSKFELSALKFKFPALGILLFSPENFDANGYPKNRTIRKQPPSPATDDRAPPKRISVLPISTPPKTALEFILKMLSDAVWKGG